MLSTLIYAGGVACGIGILLVLLLAKPLYGVLGDACGSNRRASFWTVYSAMMLMLAPAIGVLFLAAFPIRNLELDVLFARGLFFGLLALIAALLVLGRTIATAAFVQLRGEARGALPASQTAER